MSATFANIIQNLEQSTLMKRYFSGAAECIDLAAICPQVASNKELFCQLPNMTILCPKTCGDCGK